MSITMILQVVHSYNKYSDKHVGVVESVVSINGGHCNGPASFYMMSQMYVYFDRSVFDIGDEQMK